MGFINKYIAITNRITGNANRRLTIIIAIELAVYKKPPGGEAALIKYH
jgi:hypothetical protein